MNNLVVFSEDGIELEVNVTPEQETVWLTQEQMSVLFDTARSSIAYHIGNIFKDGELSKATSVEFFDRSNASRPPAYYNLDVIISVGYRVKSQRGIAFRRWATKILKQYLIDGVAVNEKRLKALQRTVQIESRMLAGVIGVEEAAALFLYFLDKNGRLELLHLLPLFLNKATSRKCWWPFSRFRYCSPGMK